IDKMFDKGNDANQERSVGKGDDVLEEVVALDASKLRDDHQSLPPPTGGKSLSALRRMVLEGSAIPSDATEPLINASMTPMSDVGPVDSVSRLYLWTRPPHMRYVVSSDSSHYSGSYSKTASLVRSVTDVSIVTVFVTTTVDANVSIGPKAKDAPKDFEHIGDYAWVPWILISFILSSMLGLRGRLPSSEKDTEIAHLRSLLSLKEAEAAEAISFRSQLSVVEATNASKGTELRDLKEKNFALEGENNVLSERVETLESVASFKEVELASLSSQDEQVGVLSDRVAAIDSELMEMTCLSEVPFIDRVPSTMVEAIGCAIDKGIQDGLAAGIEHGIAGRSITDVARFNLFAKSDYIAAINALQGVSFLLLALLEANKDTSMADIIDLLHLEGPAAETSDASQLQPLLDQLMILIHRLKDQVIIGETYLAFSLEVTHNRVQRLRRDA
nr:hypothetical protein [Tanacetum cinerariifolium]